MKMSSRFVSRSLSAVVVAASLSFGVQQAAATVAAPALRACPANCEEDCIDLGFDWGRCSGDTCKCGRSGTKEVALEPSGR